MPPDRQADAIQRFPLFPPDIPAYPWDMDPTTTTTDSAAIAETTPAETAIAETAIAVEGMTCASCVAHVDKALRAAPGVSGGQINLARGRAVVRYDPAVTDPDRIATAIAAAGYGARPESTGDSPADAEDERLQRQIRHARTWFRRALVGIALWLPVELAHWIAYLAGASHSSHLAFAWIGLATSTLAIGYVGWGFYKSAWSAARHGTTNMDTLISLGATVAYAYSLVAFIGHLAGAWTPLPHLYFMEATGLLALISLGHWLEARARDAAGSAIRELLQLTPATALRLDDGDQPTETPVANLQRGDRVLIRPGDRIPIDGVVTDGVSNVDESMISGEPLPVKRQADDEVIGGTVNQDGRLTVRVTRVGAESALSHIVQLVETAQAAKPPVQKLADRIAAIFVPTVLGIALLTAVGWYAWGAAHDWPSATTWGMMAKAVCSVLIIACPCALGLALPAAIMVGTGRGANRGILIRDIDALQQAERLDTVVLDKTGTITVGRPTVTAIHAADTATADEAAVLRLAAAAERFSEHPLAKAIVAAAAARGIESPFPDSFANESGFGVTADVQGRTILVGSAALLAKHALSPGAVADAAGHTVVHVAQASANDSPGRWLGTLVLSDPIKPDSAAALDELRSMGLATILLSGDNHAAAVAIARSVGIDDVRADVKPDGKAAVIESLKSTANGERRRIAMVGDGINDAPALATADLGIAIGTGSDVAKETGDIVLVNGSLHGVAAAIRLSRATMRVIRQNLFWAFAYNVLAIPLAAFGLLNPLIAAAAMALSDVTVIGNALRLRRSKID